MATTAIGSSIVCSANIDDGIADLLIATRASQKLRTWAFLNSTCSGHYFEIGYGALVLHVANRGLERLDLLLKMVSDRNAVGYSISARCR